MALSRSDPTTLESDMPQPLLPHGLDALRPAPRYRLWTVDAHRFVHTAIERGAVSPLLETRLFEGHELEVKFGLSRYRDLFDAELTRDALVDTYLHFRRNWLVLARPTAKEHARYFCRAVRNRIVSAHRRWGARIVGDLDGPGDDPLVSEELSIPAMDGRVEAAATLAALRALAAAIEEPLRRAAILARLEGEESQEIAARLGVNAATERTWWSRFRGEAGDKGLLLAA